MQITSGLNVNGATTHCLLLARELAERGHEIVFLCRPESWIREQASAEGFEVVESDLHRWPADELRRISTFVQHRGVDVVHTHMSRAHAFGVLLRWMSGVPCVATAHSCRVQFHWMFNDLVIAVSDKTRRFHESYNLVQPHRILTIHKFVDDRHIQRLPDHEKREVRRSFGVGDGELLVGAVGAVCPKKGQLHLIHALPQLLQQIPNARLLVLGDPGPTDYVRKVKAEALALGVDSKIIWAGGRNDASRIVPAFDVSVLASQQEDFPLTILEAMAASVPVVATDVGGVAECVSAGETGLLVPPCDSDALGKALVSLAASPQTREALGEAGRRRLLRSFSTRSQTNGIEKALSSVVRRRTLARAA
jgi:glycosyltransferase involved in cell wall biosynthesis